MPNILETFQYDSIHAYAQDARNMDKATTFNRTFIEEYRPKAYGKAKWFGPFDQNYAAAANALEHGWLEGRDQASKLAKAIRDKAPKPENIRRRIRRSDQGDSLEIQDVYCGRLSTAWRVAKRDHRAQGLQEIWLAHYMGLSFREDGHKLFWRGAAIAAACEVLTEAGYSVGILAHTEQIGSHEGHDHRIEVVVKSPLDPLNVDALAGAIINPAFYRILYWEWCASRSYDLQTGLGMPSSYDLPSNYIKGTESVSDERSAVAYLTALVEKINA